MQYANIERYILDVPKFTVKNTVEDTAVFLELLCSPEKKRRIIHVAGTNGKGSVCAYLSSVLKEAGYTTGWFSSPHLIEMRERFRINDKMISKKTMCSAFEQVMAKLGLAREVLGKKDYHPTFFELLFFMGMIIFDEANVDVLILETGLGGRLDATNAVKTKHVTVITEIGMDHMEYLGDTIAKIAYEKAGILRKQVPVVCCDKRKEASAVIAKQAQLLGAETFFVSIEDVVYKKLNNKSIDFSFRTRYYNYIRLTLSTKALYQIENAALAVRAIEVLDEGRTITKEQIQKGIRNTRWEGRMEELLPGIFVDGAHNEDGVQAFIETVKNDNCKGKRYLLFGVSADKPYRKMIGLLMAESLFEQIAAAGFANDRTAAVSVLKNVLEDYTDENTSFFDKAPQALFSLMKKKGKEDIIYIVGSLYLVGEIKTLLRRRTDDSF